MGFLDKILEAAEKGNQNNKKNAGATTTTKPASTSKSTGKVTGAGALIGKTTTGNTTKQNGTKTTYDRAVDNFINGNTNKVKPTVKTGDEEKKTAGNPNSLFGKIKTVSLNSVGKKTQEPQQGQTGRKENIFDFDPNNKDIPDTYMQNKANGKRAGFLDLGWRYKEENAQSLNPITARDQMAWAEAYRNTGYYDNDPNAQLWQLSDQQRNKLHGAYSGKIGELNAQMSAGGVDSVNIPEGADEEGINTRLQKFLKDWREKGLVTTTDPSGKEIQYDPGTGLKEGGNQQGIAQDMFRYIYGEDAFLQEMDDNGGGLSEGSLKQMTSLLGKVTGMSEDEEKNLKFQRDTYQALADELDRYGNMYGEYEGMMADAAQWAEENGAEAGYRSDIDTWESGYTGGIQIRPSDKAAEIYSMFQPGTQNYNRISSLAYGNDDMMDEAASAYDHALFYLPDEIEQFQKYMNAGRPDLALAFHEGLKNTLDYRYGQWKTGIYTRWSDTDPLGTGAASVATQKLTAAEGLKNAAGRLFGMEGWDTYGGNQVTAFTQTVRQNIAGNVGKDIFGLTGSELAGKFASNAVNSIFSGIDSGTDYFIGKNVASKLVGLGLVKPAAWKTVAEIGSLGTMFGEVYQNSFYNTLQETGDGDYAMVTGVVDGIQEVLGETIFGANIALSQGASARKVAGAMLGEEEIEELTGALREPVVNTIKDNLYEYAKTGRMSGKTQWDKDATALAKANPDQYSGEQGRQQAYADALMNKGIEMVWTAVGTAISVGPKALGAQGQQQRAYTQKGEAIIESDQVKDFAKIVIENGDPETRERGQALLDKAEQGKKISKSEIGALFQAISSQNNDKISAVAGRVLEQNIRGFLKDTYTGKDGQARIDDRTMGSLAEIIRKGTMDGGSISQSDRKLLERYPAAMDLFNDMQAYEQGEQVDPMKRSGGMIGDFIKQQKQATQGFVDTARQLGEMAKTQAQKHIDSLREEYVKYQKMQQRAGDAVKTAGEKMADGETAKNLVGRIWENAKARTEEARANGTLGAETGPKSEEEAKRKAVVFTDENGQETGGTLVRVETKVVDEQEQKKGPREGRPQGYVAQDADREGPVTGTSAETAPEQKAGPRTDRPQGYVAQDADREGPVTGTTAETAPEEKRGPRTDRPQNYVAQDADREGPAAETTTTGTTAENAPEQKAGPREDRPRGYVAQDANREGPAAETVAEAPAAEAAAPEQENAPKRKIVRQYVVRTVDGTEIRTDAVTAKAADASTAAAMTYIETSDMSDQEASDLLDVVTSEGVPIGDMEALLKDARNVMTRGWLGDKFPTEIGYSPEAARALYQKGQNQKITDEETRKGGRKTTLNPGNGKVTYRGVNVDTLDGETRKQVEAAAMLAKRVGYNLIFENDTKNRNRYGEYDAATGSVVINLAGTDGHGRGHHLMVAMSHEVTHLLEHNSPEAYAQLREFVFGEMARNGVDLINRIGQKMDNYNYQIRKMRENGQNLNEITIGGAAAEVVADACDQVFGNEKLIQKLANENPTLFEKVKNAVADFINKVKDAARGMRESGSLDSAAIRDVDKLAERWGIALDEARTGKAPAQNAGNAAESQQRQASYRNTINETYDEQFDKLNTKNSSAWNRYDTIVFLKKTPAVYVEAGMNADIPMTMQPSNFRKATRESASSTHSAHGIDINEFRNADESIGNPYFLLVQPSRNSVIAFTDITKDGKPVAIPFIKNKRYDTEVSNDAISAFELNNPVEYIENILKNDENAYIVTNENNVAQSLERANSISAVQGLVQRYYGIIAQDGEQNNSKSGQTQSSQMSLGEAERESGYTNEDMARASVATDQNGERLFSLASMEHDRDLYRQMLVNSGIMKDSEIDGLFRTIDKAMGTIREDRAILDMNETFGKDERAFLPVKPNSDPLYQVSLDFSTLCRKRLLQQALQEMIEKKYKTVMTKAERVAMRNALQELQKEGKRIEIACALCYVESARLKSPAQIQKFMENKRGYIVDYLSKSKKDYKQKIDAAEAAMKESFGYDAKTSLKEIKKKNSAHERAIRAMKRRMYQEYAPTAQEESIIRAAETMDESMYKTAAGLAKLKRDYPMIFDAFTTSVRNATKSKGIEGDTPFYAGDTKSISDELIERMNKENGLRSQSWSDFQTYHILDYMGAIIELSTRKAKMQAYTKVPDYIRLMGLTGQMINASLIPMDYNGENLQYDPKEGMPYEIAQQLRDQYPDTVGNICIGISDDHIRALLANDDIDYVIPYHKSSMDKKTRQRMGLKNWSEYESQQNEQPQDYENTDKNGKDYQKKPDFSEWYNYQEASEIARAFEASGMSAWDASKLAMQEMANRYIELCHERGLQEKFANFSGEDGYWKLLIDRKMINQKNGKLIEQQAVRPVFDSDVIQDILKNEVKQVRETQPDIEEATDAILKQWEAGDIQKAARTKEVQDAVRAFDDHMIVQNVVEMFRDEQQKPAAAAAETETEAETEDAEEDMPMAAAMSLADISEIQEKQQDLIRTRERVHEIETSKELQDAITKAMKEGNFDDYNEILSRTKLADMKRKVSRLEDEIQTWQKEYEEERNRKNLSKEQQAIAKSGLTEPEYRNRQAVKHFGTTTNPMEAGYIIRNGSMLNFSGEKGKHYGYRASDHREIGTIYEDDNIQGSAAMVTFMNDGNVRVMPESTGIDISNKTEPTAEQYRAIRKLVNAWAGEGEFAIDFSDEQGNNIDSIVYEGRISADKVIADIQHFYETGEVRQPSSLSRFFSFAEEGPAASDWIMAMDPNDIDMGTKAEKALVRNYQKTRREVDSIEARIAQMREQLKTAKGDEARKLRINLQTEQGKLKRARDMLNGLTSGKEFGYMLRRAQESISYLMGMKSQEDVNRAADRMRDKAEEMRRTAAEAAGMLEKIADREEAAVQRRYFNNNALRQAAGELGEYFGIKDTGRIEDGLVEIGLHMIANDSGFEDSLYRMADRVLEEMYGTAGLLDANNSKEVYAEQKSEIIRQVLLSTQRFVPGMQNAKIESIDRREIQGLLDYVKQVGSMTRQAAAGMQRVAGMAQELKQQTEDTKAATAEIRRKLGTAIRYYDNLNKQADALASAERMERTIRQIESKAAKQVLEAQMKFAHTIENDRNVRRLANENLMARHRINTAYRRMAKLILDESDLKNVPANLQGVARAAIRMVLQNDANDMNRKLTGLDRQTLLRSRNTLELIDARDGKDLNLQGVTDFLGEDDVAVAIEEALRDIDEGVRFWNSGNGRTAVALEGDKAALGRISKGLSQIYEIVTRSQQVFLDGKQTALSDAAYEVDAEARKRDVYQEYTGGLGKAVKGLHRTVWLGNMTPEYFFKNMKNNGISMLFNEFKNSEDRYGRIMNEAKTKVSAAAEKAGFGSWDMEQKHTIELESGRQIQLTLGEMMSIAATAKREATLGPEMSQHLEKGGIVLEQKKERKLYGREATEQKPIRLSMADTQSIINAMTTEQAQYVEDMVAILTKDMGKYGNEASRRMYGIDKYKETYYFPFQVWDGVKNKASNAGSSVNPTNNNRAAHQSFTNRRKNNAANALLIRDFNTVCAEHINQMATYATFGAAIENMNRVLNFRVLETGDENDENQGTVDAVERNIESILKERYGQNAVDYLRQFMLDLNGGAVQKNAGLGQSLMSMFKKNAVGGSLSVALQQPLSYIRASTMIDTKYLARALDPQYYKGSYNEMMAHSGVAVIKDMGKFDMNFARGAAEWLAPETLETSKARRVYNTIEDKTNALPEKMDQMTWTRMWSAVKIEQHAQHPEMDMQSDEFLDMVGKRFNDVMRRTQVYDSVLVKSQLMRSQGWFEKTITAFRAEPTISLNMFMDAWINRKEAGGKKNAAAVAATFLLGAIAQAAVKGIMGAGRNPDEKKTLAENFAYRFGSSFISEANPLGLIPGYDNIVDALSGNDINDNAWGMIKTFGKSLQAVWNPPTGENLNATSAYRYIEDTVGQITQMMSGVPAKNLMRDSRAVLNWFMGGYADRAKTDKDGNIIPGRATNANVLKYQMIDQVTASDMLNLLNATTGLSVWGGKTSDYERRIYEAERDGNPEAAAAYREYLTLGKGVSEKTISSAVASAAKKDTSRGTAETAEFLLDNGYADKTSWITEQYKKGELTEDEVRGLYEKYFPDKAKDMTKTFWKVVEDAYKAGEISRAEAEKKYRQYYPKATADDIYSKFDMMEYELETGKEASGDYYRMHDAIEQNDTAAISKAVKELKGHGKKKNGFMKSIENKWDKVYTAMRNGSPEKVKLRDGITKAMRAVGYSNKDIDKMFAKWEKGQKK